MQGAQGGGLALHSVATAALSSLTVRFNFASQAGGGMAVMGGGAVTLADSSLSSNRAPLGGALVADSCRLQLQRVNFTANTAAPAGKEVRSCVRQTRKACLCGSVVHLSLLDMQHHVMTCRSALMQLCLCGSWVSNSTPTPCTVVHLSG